MTNLTHTHTHTHTHESDRIFNLLNPQPPFVPLTPLFPPGNMATSVVLTMTGPFTVVPAVLLGPLAPGEKGECEVSYFPATQQHVTGKLALSLSGDQVHYQVSSY